jgi:hypothetical protein
MDRNEILHDPRHLGFPSGASKMISEAMVCLVQTVDLSRTDTNTISKETETRFYMTHITLEFHWVRPKWFLRLRYVWHKPYTYVESRLALYPNGPKRASIWASSPRSTIRCVQMTYEAMVHLSRMCTYLTLKLTLSPNEPKRASIWTSSPRSTIQCIQNNFWAYGTFGANRAPIMHQN